LATLAAASIGIVAIATSIMVLELYRLGEASAWEGARHVAARLSRNPLILSIIVGILISVVGVELPSPVSTSLHVLGGTTSAVAVFMLGAFLYGKKYTNLTEAFGLSLLRIIFLPTLAFLNLMLFSLSTMSRSLLILMYGDACCRFPFCSQRTKRLLQRDNSLSNPHQFSRRNNLS